VIVHTTTTPNLYPMSLLKSSLSLSPCHPPRVASSLQKKEEQERFDKEKTEARVAAGLPPLNPEEIAERRTHKMKKDMYGRNIMSAEEMPELKGCATSPTEVPPARVTHTFYMFVHSPRAFACCREVLTLLMCFPPVYFSPPTPRTPRTPANNTVPLKRRVLD